MDVSQRSFEVDKQLVIDLSDARRAAAHRLLTTTGVDHDDDASIVSVAGGAVVGASRNERGSTWCRIDPDPATCLVAPAKARPESIRS
jgi:predicted TIM-barrel enzyme